MQFHKEQIQHFLTMFRQYLIDILCYARLFFVRTRKKLKGAKTQENGNSRKKLKLKEKIPFSGIF